MAYHQESLLLLLLSHIEKQYFSETGLNYLSADIPCVSIKRTG